MWFILQITRGLDEFLLRSFAGTAGLGPNGLRELKNVQIMLSQQNEAFHF